MKKVLTMIAVFGVALFLANCSTTPAKENSNPQFVIEREIPGAGSLTNDQLKAASQNSCAVLRELGPEIQWLHSYVTADKVYCVYTAPNKDMIIEHAKRAGVPANLISEVSTVISPANAE